MNRDAHSGMYAETAPQLEPTHASDHAARMARQAEKQIARLGRSIAITRGQFTRTRRRGRRSA